MYRRLRDESGFSLVELSVVMTLLGVVGGMGGNALISTLNASDDVQQRTVAVAAVRSALDTVARDVRAANPLGSSPTASDMGLSIYCSSGSDCSTTNRRMVGYAVTADRLTRTIGGVSAEILDGDLTSPSVFTYLDAEGNELLSPVSSGCVQQVRISVGTTTRSGHRVADATTVTVRNAATGSSC
jgi:prepilin-type N-terminal cleavage/methylation domain-containing protein